MSKQPSFKRARPVAPSGDQLFGWVKELVELTEQYTEFRRLGTQGDAAARAWLMKTLAEIGIKDVVEQTYPVAVRQYKEWSLTVDGKGVDCFFMNGAAFTEASGVSGELYYAGDSIDPNVDLTGKIVVFDLKSGPAMKGKAIPLIADYSFDPKNELAEQTVGGSGGPAPSNFPTPYYEAARLGAVGFIAVFSGRQSDANTFFADPTGMVQTRIPGVFLKGSLGSEVIQDVLSSSRPLQATLTLRGDAYESTSGNAVVHVAGQKNDAMLVNTHHDAGWSGAVQDASGVAVVLGLAAYYDRFPSNYIQKDLYFVFNGCHYTWNYPYGANKFAEMNPEIMRRTLLCMGVEHIGKRFVGKDGGLHDTGQVEPRLLWVPRNQMLYDAAIKAVEGNALHSTIIPKAGAIPLYGETQSYFLQGIPCFSIMSMPEYLFFAEDTIDKVAKDELAPVMHTMLDIIDSAMYLPKTWIAAIDR